MITVFLTVVFPLFSIEEKHSEENFSFFPNSWFWPVILPYSKERQGSSDSCQGSISCISLRDGRVGLPVYFSLTLPDRPYLLYFLYKLCHHADHLSGHITCRCPLFYPQTLMPGSNTPCSLRKWRSGQLHVSEGAPSVSPRSFWQWLPAVWKSSLSVPWLGRWKLPDELASGAGGGCALLHVSSICGKCHTTPWLLLLAAHTPWSHFHLPWLLWQGPQHMRAAGSFWVCAFFSGCPDSRNLSCSSFRHFVPKLPIAAAAVTIAMCLVDWLMLV